MDIGTIVGIVSAFILIIVSIMLGGSLGGFIDIPSIVVVVGGTVAATLVAYPLARTLNIFKLFGKAMNEKKMDYNALISSIVELANKARKEGLLALEESANNMEDEFTKKGIALLVDGTDPELVKNLLETELAFMEDRHKLGQGLFDTMGSLAPAFGMIGTLIGLVQMLANLSDPTTIGPSMAVALLTTFYGSVLANVIFIPIANKLKLKTKEEVFEKEIIIEGILSIQSGENPRIIEEKLKSFLPPSLRVQSQEGEATNG